MGTRFASLLLAAAALASTLSHAFEIGRGASSSWSRPSALSMNSETSSTHFHGIPDESFNNNNDQVAHGISSCELRNMSAARQRRLQEEKDLETRFLTGDALHQLRQDVLQLRGALAQARRHQETDRVQQLETAILKAQQVDAEFVYQVASERAEAAQQAGLVLEAARYKHEAKRARKALPQFNLDGLWVGRYGDQGFEMINVTYVQDTLVAYKVTGDRNVPMGQVSFTVDLSQNHQHGVEQEEQKVLAPIELSSDAAEQWGSRYLERFAGKGQVASPGYVNSKWLNGQLILVKQYFSFAWLPIEHQVFFGRPSAELTLKLLKESRAKQFAEDLTREHLDRCLEETQILQEDETVHEQEYYYQQEGCFE